MANEISPQQEQLVKQLAAIKGGSTTDILTRLFNIANQIKEVASDQITTYNRMVVMDARAAGMHAKFERNRSRLMETTLGIQSSITQLNQNRATAELAPSFEQIFRPLQSDVQLREKERKELQENVKSYIQDLRTTTKEVIQDMQDDKPKPK